MTICCRLTTGDVGGVVKLSSPDSLESCDLPHDFSPQVYLVLIAATSTGVRLSCSATGSSACLSSESAATLPFPLSLLIERPGDQRSCDKKNNKKTAKLIHKHNLNVVSEQI